MENNPVLIDTNLYLDDANIIFKLFDGKNKILIPKVVLRELDDKKYNRNLSYSARKAIQTILEFSAKHESSLIFDTDTYGNKAPDDEILAVAKKHKATVATKDICMSVTAKSLGLKAILYDTVLNNVFNPYIEIHMGDFPGELQFSYLPKYENKAYFRILNKLELDPEAWWFLFIDVDKENKIVYANNPFEYCLDRIDNNPKYREIEDDFKFKTKDIYQVCGLYALTNAPHVLITGKWGSGKTLMATAHALATNEKKSFITRAPVGINSKYDIGFLPGNIEDKLVNWMQGFTSSLYYLYANTKYDRDHNGNFYDYVKDSIFNEKFEIMPMNSIQGLSLLKGDMLIVDEVQLVTVDYLSMILSRPSEGGRLVLLGDISQTYDVVKPAESGLLKLLRVMPHKYLAHIELKNSYRSPLIEVADKLQDKSIL